MEEVPVEEDIDLEALQAQIDLSLAHTKELVSSWLNPTQGNAFSSKSKSNTDKEIEEILRRPPRLGVGAPVPASTGSLGYESIKLKNKLSGKKRPREDGGDHDTPASDDEEESRAGAIKKKTKLDPFAPKERKKKKVSSTLISNGVPTTDPVPSERHQSVPAVNTSPSEHVVAPANLSFQVADVSPLTTAPGKKKKKKKKPTAIVGDRVDTHEPTEKTAIISPAEQHSDDHGDVNSGAPTSPRKLADHEEFTPTKRSNTNSLTRSPEVTKSSISLLNLQGPPPDSALDSPSPAKKKRRKRRKNKKNRVVDTLAGVESEGDNEQGDDP